MSYNLDVTSDYSHKELYSFLNTDLPAFVKEAELATKESTAALNDEAFADRYHRAYPIDSAPNVFVSNAFFVNKKAALVDKWGENYVLEVETRIKKAADLLNITEDIERYNSSCITKQAKDYTEQFVASFDVDGATYDLFPYKTASDLNEAAVSFNNNIKNYPFSWRQKIAQNFVKLAEDNGIEELPDLVCKYAGLFFPDNRNFQAELSRRMNKLADTSKEKYKAVIDKAASVSSKDEAFELCNAAYVIEKEAGAYDNNTVYRQLGDIVDKTFVLSLDKVADFLNVVEMAGEPYSITELQKISKDIYKQAFGVDLDPSDINGLKETLPTMPLSDVALFRELSGVKSL